MSHTTWGKMLRCLRKERKMSLEKLAFGLCSKQALSNIERGNVQADKLLLDLVLQRLGKSPDRQEIILSWESYHLEETIDRLEQSIQQRNRKEAEKYREEFARLLVRGKNSAAGEYMRMNGAQKAENGAEDKRKDMPPKLDRVREMYWRRIRAEWAYWLEKDREQAKAELFAAAELTMPGWSKRELTYYAVSTVEMENLLALARIELADHIRARRGLTPALRRQAHWKCWELPESTLIEKEGARTGTFTLPVFLRECLRYIRSSFTDGQERAEIFAKCAWLLSYIEAEQGNLPEACKICEEAAEGLRNYGISAFLAPVLERLCFCYERAWEYCERARADGAALSFAWERDWKGLGVRFGRYLTALRHVHEKCGLAWKLPDSIFVKSYQKSYHLDYELILSERLAQGITREKMAEGIYQSEKTLWKFETKKNSAHGEKFRRLMGRLYAQKGRCNPLFAPDSYAALELKDEIDHCMGKKEYERAGELLRKLEEGLDTGNAENRRSLLSLRWILELDRDGICCKEMLKNHWKLLKMTYYIADGAETDGIPDQKRMEEKMFYRTPMRLEAGIINQIALLLGRLEHNAEAEAVYKALLKSIESSDVAPRYRYRLLSLPFGKLAKCLHSVKLSREALCYELSCGKLNSLGFLLMVWAGEIENDSPDRAESREMVMDAYYLCELSKNYKYRDEIRRDHNDLYGFLEQD